MNAVLAVCNPLFSKKRNTAFSSNLSEKYKSYIAPENTAQKDQTQIGDGQKRTQKQVGFTP